MKSKNNFLKSDFLKIKIENSIWNNINNMVMISQVKPQAPQALKSRGHKHHNGHSSFIVALWFL